MERLCGAKTDPHLSQLGYSIATLDKRDGFDLTNRDLLDKIEKLDVLVHLAALSFAPDSLNPLTLIAWRKLISTD